MIQVVTASFIFFVSLLAPWVWHTYYDNSVIVIGAGLSGVSAAKHLQESGEGLHVVVLEALDRVGGRIHTLEAFDGAKLELGAAFIHKYIDNPITELAKKYGAVTKPYDYTKCTYYDEDGTPIPHDVWNKTYHFWKELIFEDFMEYRDKLPDDMDQPMSVTLDDMDFYEEDLTPLERKVFDLLCFQYIVQDVQADLQVISTYEYDESHEFIGGPNSDLVIESGYSHIVRGLAEHVNVLFNQYVNEIRASFTSARVRTEAGVTYEGNYVIVSVPIGVLKSHRIQFSPPLPTSVLNAIADLGLSDTIKAALCWKTEDIFWPVHGDHTLHFHKYAATKYKNKTSRYGRGEHLEFVNVHDLYNNGCLLMETETEFATKLSRMTKDEITNRIMEDLCLMFKNCTWPSKGVAIADWATNKAFLGGFAHWRVDSGRDENELFAADDILHGRVLFAGEHTSWKYYGNTHGAYVSGIAAADRMLAQRRHKFFVVWGIVGLCGFVIAVAILRWKGKEKLQ